MYNLAKCVSFLLGAPQHSGIIKVRNLFIDIVYPYTKSNEHTGKVRILVLEGGLWLGYDPIYWVRKELARP